MSEFHYVRTRGADGGVDACEGPAIGLDLETVLKDGLPPWNVALEIAAALCEVLDIADEDGEIHGDVHPKFVFIDETGAVSLEGFGVKRKKTRGPDGVPKDTRSDLYGLGYTAYRCFCDLAFPEGADGDPTTHDDRIVDAALAIDLSSVPPQMQGDIQWYVAKLLASDPAERPRALDAWRTFIAFANAWEGPDAVDIVDWCGAALDGGGVRRPATQPGAAPNKPRGEPASKEAAPASSSAGVDEELGGPVVRQGPLTSNFRFEDGGGAKGAGATAFWNKDDMKKALDSGTPSGSDTPAGGKRRTPSAASNPAAPPAGGDGAPRVGGGSATSFWSQSQLDAMARGDENAPRPRRADGEGERRRFTAAQRPPTGAVTPTPARPVGNRPPLTGQPSPVRTATPSGAPASSPPASEASAKAASRAQTVQYVLSPEEMARMDAEEAARKAVKAKAKEPAPRSGAGPVSPKEVASKVVAPEPEGGGVTVMLFGGGIAAVGLFVAGALIFLAVVVIIVIVWTREPPPPPALPIRAPRAGLDDEARGDEVAVVDAGDATLGSASPDAPTTPSAAPSSVGSAPAQPASAPVPGPQPRPSAPNTDGTAEAPAPVPVQPAETVRPRPKPTPDGSARVAIKSSSRGSVSGCTKAKIDFEGMNAFSIDGYQLPATCLVTIDGSRGVFQVYGTGEITCDKQGSAVLCDKSQVP